MTQKTQQLRNECGLHPFMESKDSISLTTSYDESCCTPQIEESVAIRLKYDQGIRCDGNASKVRFARPGDPTKDNIRYIFFPGSLGDFILLCHPQLTQSHADGKQE